MALVPPPRNVQLAYRMKDVTPIRNVFVGRDRELGELAAGLEEAISGRGRLFLLFGEPGVGKTRLADEISLRARARGVLTLWARCWEGGDAPIYWPWTQAIRSYLAGCDSKDLEPLGAGSDPIARIIPELQERLNPSPDPRSTLSSNDLGASFSLFDAVASFFRRASRSQPLMLVLDDLHAGDTPSFLLLEFLIRELRGLRLLIVATYRDVEARRTAELSRILGSLARESRYLGLRGLSEDEVATFISETAGFSPREPVVRAVYQATEGNPFFVDEMVRFLITEGHLNGSDDLRIGSLGIPQGLREAIRRRMETLPPATKEVLSIGSVIGREFDLELLARVHGSDVGPVLEALRVAESYDVVAGAPMASGHYCFSHVLVRETLYHEIPLTRRTELHHRIGEMLEDLHGNDPESYLPSLAHHFLQGTILGRRSDKAIAYCVRAAKRAASLGAHEEAAALYEGALEALTLASPIDERARSELLLDLGEVQWRAGQTSRARSTFEQAADLARRLGDTEGFARAALALATSPAGVDFVYCADTAPVALLEEALQGLGRDDSVLGARLLARLASVSHSNLNGSAEARERLGREAAEMADRLGDPAARLAALYGRMLSMLGPDGLQERIDGAAEILRLASELGDQETLFRGHQLRLRNFLESGDLAAVDAEIASCAMLAERLRQPFFGWQVGVFRTMRALSDGQLEAAERHGQSTLEIGEQALGEAAPLAFAAGRLAQYFAQGRLAELEASIKTIAEQYSRVAAWRGALAFLYSQLGRKGEARNELERLAKNGFVDLRSDGDWYATTWFLSMTCAYLGDSSRASLLYERLLPFADRCFVGLGSVSLGSVPSMLGHLAATMGSFADGARHFENALRRNAETENQPFQALTLVQYAQMLLFRDAPDDRKKARELAGRAVEISESVGMGALKLEAEKLFASAAAESPNPQPRSTFHRAGDHWTISYEGRVFHVKDSIGLHYLAYLLRNPGRKIPAAEIVLFAEGVQADSNHDAISDREIAELGLHRRGFGDAGEMLDSQAKQSYKHRLADLESELLEAKAFNDLGRAEALFGEREFLVRELSAGFGVRGRSRKAASFSERARLNVTRAIRSAIERIAQHSRPLAIHLKTSVETGKSCSYLPDPRSAKSWIF